MTSSGMSSEEPAGRPNQSSAAEDVALLGRIKAGSTEEFAEIVRRYQNRVFSILYRYERDAQRLEDLAQAEPADISDIPAIGEQAAAVLEAARTEVVRRRIPLGGEDTAAA